MRNAPTPPPDQTDLTAPVEWAEPPPFRWTPEQCRGLAALCVRLAREELERERRAEAG